MSGFSFGSLRTSVVPQAKAAVDPTKCQIDITFLIDNSGSMDDNGADKVLKNILRPKLSDYFAERGFNGDRGALFTYSYETGLGGDGEGFPDLLSPANAPSNPNTPKVKTHVLYNEDRSIQRALGTLGHEGIRTLNWNAPESFIGVGITAASNYARQQKALTGRTQFIFIAGDEQADKGVNGVESRIRTDGQNGIIYYTFALRKEISVQPYQKIAQINADARDGDRRFYRGNGFQDTLIHDMDRDCTPPEAPSVKFCVQDQDTKEPVTGAWITDDIALRYISKTDQRAPIGPDNPDYPGLRTGPVDGCTNPDYIDYAKLTKDTNTKVSAEAEHHGYKGAVTQIWKYLEIPNQVVTIDMAKDDCDPNDPRCVPSTITSAAKRADPSVVTPGQTQTEVGIDFTVRIKNSKPITNIVLKEELASDMVFGATPNFRLKKPDGTVVSVPGTPDATRKIASLAIDTVAQSGTYTLMFTGRYVGPVDNTYHPIDVIGACAPNAHAGSRFEFKKGDSTDGCTIVDAGSIKASDGIHKITLGADVLFGNKSLTLNNQLVLGANGPLVVTGQTVTGDKGTSIVFDRNNIPTGGKLSWNAVKNNVQSVVNRWINTKAVRVWNCPNGVIDIGSEGSAQVLYLNTTSDKSNPTQQPTEGLAAPKFTMWQFINPVTGGGCTVNFKGEIRIVGTGTLVNKGGQAFIHGSIAPDSSQNKSRYAMGYAGFQAPGVADSGKVVVYDQSVLTGVIIYTEGTLEIGTIDATVPATSVGDRTHRAAFIGNSMKFPPLRSLRSSISLQEFTGRNAFPPFVQTYLPQSDAAP